VEGFNHPFQRRNLKRTLIGLAWLAVCLGTIYFNWQ
jgi:hypothetical protein